MSEAMATEGPVMSCAAISLLVRVSAEPLTECKRGRPRIVSRRVRHPRDLGRHRLAREGHDLLGRGSRHTRRAPSLDHRARTDLDNRELASRDQAVEARLGVPAEDHAGFIDGGEWLKLRLALTCNGAHHLRYRREAGENA